MYIFPCTLSCLLADGSKAQVSDAVRLHVRLLSFSCYHNYKIVNGGTFPAILGLDFWNGRNCEWFCPLGTAVFPLHPT